MTPAGAGAARARMSHSSSLTQRSTPAAARLRLAMERALGSLSLPKREGEFPSAEGSCLIFSHVFESKPLIFKNPRALFAPGARPRAREKNAPLVLRN